MNRVYDLFVATYGPINKTTFGETADGTVIRRMPNLVKFREDPDAMLVMSLEDYDEATGRARKAAIMMKDVVGQTPAYHLGHLVPRKGSSSRLTAEASLTLPFIASLYGKDEETIIAELGDLIFQDPETRPGRPADQYLSGNVRAKLAEAEAAGPAYARNAEALRAVQPEDILPGDIDANLGAPWIPEADIQALCSRPLWRLPRRAIRVRHLRRMPSGASTAGYAAERSVAATSDYGTPRANGTWLLELALNLKTPVIYDTVHERRPRGAGRKPGGDACRPRQAGPNQGAVSLLGLLRARTNRAVSQAL